MLVRVQLPVEAREVPCIRVDCASINHRLTRPTVQKLILNVALSLRMLIFIEIMKSWIEFSANKLLELPLKISL